MFHAWEEQDVEVCDANNSGDARVRSGGNEEAFNQQAQEVMTWYCEQITEAMRVDYTTNNGCFLLEASICGKLWPCNLHTVVLLFCELCSFC